MPRGESCGNYPRDKSRAIDHNFSTPPARKAGVQQGFTTGKQFQVAPGNSTIGSAEETGIRQLIVNGKFKAALDRAKEWHKARGSAVSEALLIDAYAARIQSLLEQNLAVEAKSLVDLVRARYPGTGARLDELSAASAARIGALGDLL